MWGREPPSHGAPVSDFEEEPCTPSPRGPDRAGVRLSVPHRQVNSYIEDCIAQKHPLIKVLRLICLQSVCNSGLKQKVLDHYKREVLQVSMVLND